jgi:hypothetical protein
VDSLSNECLSNDYCTAMRQTVEVQGGRIKLKTIQSPSLREMSVLPTAVAT